MPPKKGKATNKKRVPRNSEDDSKTIDIKYNPDAVNSLLEDIEKDLNAKCIQIEKETDFMVTSFQQAFNLELIKIPTNVKQMSLARFREEFKESLDAVTRGTMAGKSSIVVPHKPEARNLAVFQTPSQSRHADRSKSRPPVEGEEILSANGSPLGEFQTVVKAPKNGPSIVPPTPGVFVPLRNGEVVDIESVDVEILSQEVKEDAISKMQAMMDNMHALMSKLGNTSATQAL